MPTCDVCGEETDLLVPCPIDPQACGLMFCQICEEEEHECVHPDEMEEPFGDDDEA